MRKRPQFGSGDLHRAPAARVASIMYASVSTLYYIGTSYEISDFDYQSA